MSEYKSFVGKVNPKAFDLIKSQIRRRGLNVQSAVVLGLIQLFEIPLTLEEATQDLEGDDADESDTLSSGRDSVTDEAM